MEAYDPTIMGNWHHDIAIADGVKTSDLSAAYNSKTNVRSSKVKTAEQIQALYKTAGIADKNVLDIACNAGGHLFELNRLGIQSGFGFDIRQQWINQAHWVKRNIDFDCSNLTFAKGSFELLNDFADDHFHISVFNGIFYHLADPIAELTKVANKTSELLIINTAYLPNDKVKQPALICKSESKNLDAGLSGVEGLSWYPNGEAVLFKILKHLGFTHTRTMFRNIQNKRVCVVGSKVPDIL